MTTRKETESIKELVAETATRKARAAQARHGGAGSGTETPREVYLETCAQIAAALAESGYKYSKSGPHCRRQSGDFTYQISFQSSHNNVAGELIALWIHGTVHSGRLKEWRSKNPATSDSDVVAGGQIGNLRPEVAWMEFNLASSRDRKGTIADAGEAIREVIIPYFDRFEDLDSLVPFLVEHELPCMSIESVIEFLICFADKTAARRAAANFLIRRSDLVPDYERQFVRYSTAKKLPRPSGHAEKLAYASKVYGFGKLT